MKRLLLGLLVAGLSFTLLACGDSAEAGEDDTSGSEPTPEATGPTLEEQKQKLIGHWKMGAFENSLITINSNFRFRMQFDTTDTDKKGLLATLVFSEERDELMNRTYHKVLVQYDEGQPNATTTRPYTLKISDDGNTFEMGGPQHTRIDSTDDTSF